MKTDSLSKSELPRPRKHSSMLPNGMGAMRTQSGAAFRVWAPNASAVSVVGSFNDWIAGRHTLERENDGVWFGQIEDVKEGDEYQYCFDTSAGPLRKIDPWARKVTNSMGNGVIWWPTPPVKRFTMANHNELVIYELHIGSFHATKGKGPGTFASATQKLPHLKELGINAIEVMPVAEFAGDFSWGYNPSHPFAVESAYGGPEGFIKFVSAAHELGIAVILDVVYNHFGPSDLSLWRFDGWHENDKGGIYFYNDWKANTPWGDTRPDYGREQVRSYIHDNALMWIRDFGLDGLRLDMSVYIRTVKGNDGAGDELKEGCSLLQWINADLRKEFPSALTIAEDLHNSEWLTNETDAGGAGFSSQWDAEFVHPVRAAMIAPHDEARNLDALIAALTHRYSGNAFKRVIYSESHDEVADGKARLPTEIAPTEADNYYARKRSILAAALVLTAPGIPMLFQGQEFLEDEWFRDEVPLDWQKRIQFAGVAALYRDLIGLRLNRGGVSAGLSGQHIEINTVDHENKVLAFRRWKEADKGDDVVIVLNLSHESIPRYRFGVPSGGIWKVRLNSDAQEYSSDFESTPATDFNAVREPVDGLPHAIVTALAPYSVLIFSKDVPKATSPEL